MGHLATVLSWHSDYMPSFVLSVYSLQPTTGTKAKQMFYLTNMSFVLLVLEPGLDLRAAQMPAATHIVN